MRSKALALTCTLLLALLVSSEIKAQESSPVRTGGRLSNGVYVAFKTDYVGSKSDLSLSGQDRFIETQVVAESNVLHRVLVNSVTGSYFGYALEVEPVEGAKRFRVSIKPLSPEFQQRLRQESASRKNAGRQALPLVELQLPRFPEPQFIDDGDTLALDVLINRQTGVKIVDLITVSSSQISPSAPPSSGGPVRDFQVENVYLKVWDYQLLVNGQVAAQSTGGCRGRLIYFYLPGRGRFAFSLVPQEGFQKIGVIEQNKISFAVGGETYEWVSGSPIIEGGGNWNLWVLHEPGYRPNLARFGSDAAEIFGIGAAGDVTGLLRSAQKD